MTQGYLRRVTFFSLLALVVSASALAATPKPYQWTTAQASSAIMRQAEDFYVAEDTTRDLTKAVCRGKGKAVQRRFVAFTCTATVQGSISEGTNRLRVNARTRRAGGLCWAVVPAAIPSGCLAPGRRGEGNVGDAWAAMYRAVNDRYAQQGQCIAHGAGFFTCSWTDATGPHRGKVIFGLRPVATILG